MGEVGVRGGGGYRWRGRRLCCRRLLLLRALLPFVGCGGFVWGKECFGGKFGGELTEAVRTRSASR